MRLVNPPDCPPQNPTFSQAAVSNSPATVYLAGQVGVDPATGALAGNDVSSQTEQVFRNARVILAAAGTSLSRVVRVTIYMTDLGEWAAMNEVYQRHFGEHAPPKTTVQVSALALGARVEIEFTAEA